MSGKGVADTKAVLWKIAYRSALEAMGKDELTDEDVEFYARDISGAPEEGTCEARRHGRLEGMNSFICFSCSACGHWWHVKDGDDHYKYCPYCGRRVINDRQGD